MLPSEAVIYWEQKIHYNQHEGPGGSTYPQSVGKNLRHCGGKFQAGNDGPAWPRISGF